MWSPTDVGIDGRFARPRTHAASGGREVFPTQCPLCGRVSSHLGGGSCCVVGVLLAMVCEPLRAGAGEPNAAGVADRGPAAGVFVLGGDVADAGVQPDAVVAVADGDELALEVAR